MKLFLHTAKHILSDKKFSVLAIGIAILTRIIHLCFFYNTQVDGMYQTLAMQNFVEGHGFCFSYVLPSDISTVIYKPQINWPPGFSLLLAPFYILFNHHYIYASLALYIISAILLIIFSRKILSALGVPVFQLNLFTVVTAFFIYPFYSNCTSDAIAITFFIMAIYYVLRLCTPVQYGWKTVALASVSLCFAGLIKYLFIPVVFIVPFILFCKAMADKNRNLKRTTIFIFIFLVLTLGGLLLWQQLNTGQVAYISSTTRGFFPENLRDMHPVVPASILNTDSLPLIFKEGTMVNKLVFRFFQLLNILSVLVAVVYTFRRLSKKGFTQLNSAGVFYLLAFFISISITVLLVFLSLSVGKEENNPGHFWTYVEETRYFGLIILLIHLAVYSLNQIPKLFFTRSKYVFVFLLIIMLPETLRGVYFTTKRLLLAGKEKYSWQLEKEIQDYSRLLINRELKKNPGKLAVVTGSSYYIYHRVGMYNHIPVMTDTSAVSNPGLLNSKKPAILFVITSDSNGVLPSAENMMAQPLFPELYNREPAGTFAGYSFHIIHVEPH